MRPLGFAPFLSNWQAAKFYFRRARTKAKARTSRPTSPAARATPGNARRNHRRPRQHSSSVYSDSLMSYADTSRSERLGLCLSFVSATKIADIPQSTHLDGRELDAEFFLHR